MKLILNALIINNFKGIKSLSVHFDPYNTGIYAANEAGKTTVSDAWHWLLTGKNSVDQKDFNIKNTVDTSLNRAEHEVTGIITANGNEVILKKVYKEKWQKKRGSEETEFTGNETVYFFNEVPVTQSEYQAKISGLLPENVLKMITNPLFFNSNTTNWGWQKRREVLLAIAGNISNVEILDQIATLQNKQEIFNLTNILNSGKTLAEYKLQIGSKKKKLKDQLQFIPSRIDEANRSKLDVLPWPEIEAAISNKAGEIANIDTAIGDSNKALEAQYEAINKHQKTVQDLQTRQSNLRYQISTEINNQASQLRLQRSEMANKIGEIARAISIAKNTLTDLKNHRDKLRGEMNQLRTDWEMVNAKTIEFNQHEFTCPTCQRAFETSDINTRKQTLTDNFNKNKLAKLEEINQSGVGKSKLAEEVEGNIEAQVNFIRVKETAFNALTSDLATFDAAQTQPQPGIDTVLAGNADYSALVSQIQKLTAEAPQAEKPDNSALLSEKAALNLELDALKKQLNTREQIERCNERVAQLEAEEKTLSQQLAELEKTEFLMETFDRTKMDIMEARVNGKFKYVKFKLFDRQVNGGEAPTCETMYNAVPFSDLNTAGRIWAGMDIINTLSGFYQVSAPIFLDNRESVTNIPETDSQVINLVVSPDDREIRIVAGSEHLAVA